jgi:hypothetical protein
MLIKVKIGNVTGRSGAGTLTAIWPDLGVVPANWDEQGGTVEVEVPIRADAETWDEFHPKLLPLRLWLKGTGVDEYADLKVGLRDFHADGKQFVLNGKPIIFRGTHSGGDFPLTGYPPTDVETWRKLFETCRAWGLNHMRFHSWCPPEAAFEAADQLGFYLQPEPGMWNEISPGTPMERMLYEETERMIKAYGNHPSFMLLSASNEPKGHWKEALGKWVERYRYADPRRLYVSGTGHTEREVPELTKGTDFLAIQRIGPLMLRRESGWFGNDYGLSLVDIDLPVISHEVGQWVAYPDYEVIKKFTGYMRPGNLEIFRDSMKAHGLLEKNREFARASGEFQLACYKEEIEANQGTALVGLLDAFWQPKGYVTAEEFKQFSNTTVPLARLKRVFTTAETFDVDVEVAHYGPEPIVNAMGVWRISPAAPTDLMGEWETRTIPLGKNISLGKVSVDLSKLIPGEHRLTVTVAPATFFSSVDRKIVPGPEVVKGKTYFENSWTFWVYPDGQPRPMLVQQPPPPPPPCPVTPSAEVLVTSSWEEAEKKLAAGGRVLFVPRNSDLDWTSPPLDRVPVFWNRLMGPAWGRMLGLFIDRPISELKSHVLDGFPTSSHFDWQWAEIIDGVRAVNLDRLPAELEPVVWAIDDWNRNYKLGVIFECAMGDGRLLVSSIDVTKANDSNPVLGALRGSLLNYAHSDCFQPKVGVYPEQMRTLFFDTLVMKKLGAVAQIAGTSASNVIDGDPNTFVMTGNQKDELREPADIVITFPAPVAMAGVVLMPRQNHREHEGDIRDYVLQVSDEGNDWREVARGELPSTFAPQQIEFSKTHTARYLRLMSLSGFGTDKTTSLSELAVMYAGPKFTGKNGTIEYQRSRSATPEIDEVPNPEKPKPKPTPARTKP